MYENLFVRAGHALFLQLSKSEDEDTDKEGGYTSQSPPIPALIPPSIPILIVIPTYVALKGEETEGWLVLVMQGEGGQQPKYNYKVQRL